MNRKVAAGAALAAVAIRVAAFVGSAGRVTGQTTPTTTTPTTGQKIGILNGPTELRDYKVGDTIPPSRASKLLPRGRPADTVTHKRLPAPSVTASSPSFAPSERRPSQCLFRAPALSGR